MKDKAVTKTLIHSNTPGRLPDRSWAAWSGGRIKLESELGTGARNMGSLKMVTGMLGTQRPGFALFPL